MTEATEKKIPDFYAFQGILGQEDKLIGAGYKHSKGGGINIVVGGIVIKIFPNKKKLQAEQVEHAEVSA